MKHIVCFHLYNDYSGSPKVLKTVLENLLKKGYEVDLVTSRKGILDSLSSYDNCHLHTYSYRFSSHPLLTTLRYAWIQAYTCLWALRWICSPNVVFYINTILPIGPALTGRLMGKKVVYHYHENAFAKSSFYRFLAFFMQKLAHRIICVSPYQASFLKCQKKVAVIPNALPDYFVQLIAPNPEAAFERKTVLMLGSLKEYKGTKEFIQLAQRLPQYHFVLVINDTQENINDYMQAKNLMTGNHLTIYPRQDNVTEFYQQASLVLNLTDKRQFIETFGLTALEAMTAGLPVIVPTVGGIAEMVTDGVNGYKVDVTELERMSQRINEILSDKALYMKMADNALQYAQSYNEQKLIQKTIHILDI